MASHNEASPLTHLDSDGHMRMVDVAAKPETKRVALAEARVLLAPETRAQLLAGDVPKGDVLAAVRLAGIQAAKKTAELIPLCHPISLSHVSVDVTVCSWGVEIIARAESTGRTGVEMEALTAVNIAALTLYDMLKAVEREIVIERVQLLEKHGGKSGSWLRG